MGAMESVQVRPIEAEQDMEIILIQARAIAATPVRGGVYVAGGEATDFVPTLDSLTEPDDPKERPAERSLGPNVGAAALSADRYVDAEAQNTIVDAVTNWRTFNAAVLALEVELRAEADQALVKADKDNK